MIKRSWRNIDSKFWYCSLSMWDR